jgi:TonB family protein
MRAARVFAFLAIGAVFPILLAASDNTGLEGKLRAEYENHVVTLRRFYESPTLHFDSTGQLLNDSAVASWTLASLIDVRTVHIKDGNLLVAGQRMFLLFDSSDHMFHSLFPVSGLWTGPDAALLAKGGKTKKQKDLKPQDVSITIALVPGESEAEVRQVLSRVFLGSAEALSSSVPDLWKTYLEAREAGRSLTEADFIVPGACSLAANGNEGILPPRPLAAPDPEYSEMARRVCFQATLRLRLVVDVDGRTHNLRLSEPAGLGLDEQAEESVSQWTFSPAIREHSPVSVMINVEVSFRLP